MTSILDRPAAPVIDTKVPTVVDNPKYAWNNVDPALDRQIWAEVPAEFVSDYRAQLDVVAIEALVPLLIAVWAEHGYQVEFGTEEQVAAFGDRTVPNELLWGVWDEAALRLNAQALVLAAGLDGELKTYLKDND